MRDTYFILIGLAACVGFWVVVTIVSSHWGGWASLAEQYRCSEPFTGPCWSFQSGQFRWLAGYRNCLTIGADPRGLFLSILPLVRVAHPPLFIPWREISVSRHKVLGTELVRLRLGRDMQIPLSIRPRLAQKLRTAAGSSWPVESEG